MPRLSPRALYEGLTYRDAGVFDGVVVIDMQIALGAHGDVHQRMAGQLFQHMVEKAHAGFNVIDAGAVQINIYRDVGFRYRG